MGEPMGEPADSRSLVFWQKVKVGGADLALIPAECLGFHSFSAFLAITGANFTLQPEICVIFRAPRCQGSRQVIIRQSGAE